MLRHLRQGIGDVEALQRLADFATNFAACLTTSKPRQAGLTLVMDKGLSVAEAENLLSVAEPYIDLIKLGFRTARFLGLLVPAFCTIQLVYAYRFYSSPANGRSFKNFAGIEKLSVQLNPPNPPRKL